MKRVWYCLFNIAFLLMISATLTSSGWAMSPSQVLVVYPTNGFDSDKNGMNDSKELADYYVQKRGIPASNVLGVPISVMGVGYYYVDDYQKFYNDLVGPILIRLNKLGPTNIDVILLVGDIPKQVQSPTGPVALDNTLMMLAYLDSKVNNISPLKNPYFEPRPGFGVSLGHFNHALYKQLGKYDIYLVSRLSRMDQVDHSLYAERFLSAQPGYYNGNIYVDSKYGQGGNGAVPAYTDAYLASQPGVRSGNYEGAELETDFNIAFSEHYVIQSGFPLKWENTTNGLVIGNPGAMFSDGTSALRAPRALFYAGWYNFGQYLDVWEWLPGSVACDLNSASTFGVEALRHGASAASYVLNEPYRAGHQRPNILLYYLLNGFTFAEASTLSTPTMGWMPINEGDPLYTPIGSKTPIKDTFSPVLASGYPRIAAGAEANDRTIKVLVNDTPEPEVVVAKVEYGIDAHYGRTATSEPGYSRRPAIALKGLQNKTVYHYRLTLTDPVGNVTVTDDRTFDTAKRPS